MASLMIEVRTRVLGGVPGETTAGSDPLQIELLDEHISVGALIRRTVEERVRELVVRQRLEAAQVRQVLDRQFLTAEEVAEQAGHGAVRYPSAHRAPSVIDAEAEVRRALLAFERRAYVLLIDGRQVEHLDEVVRFAPGSRVTFLRLTPLVGG